MIVQKKSKVAVAPKKLLKNNNYRKSTLKVLNIVTVLTVDVSSAKTNG